jgi:hypothetical protein
MPWNNDSCEQTFFSFEDFEFRHTLAFLSLSSFGVVALLLECSDAPLSLAKPVIVRDSLLQE